MKMDKQNVIRIMEEIGQMSAKRGLESYAVGGLVRDFILGIQSDDLDITSNDIDALAEEMLLAGGKIIEKDSARFMGKIIYFKGLKIDLVAPRKESYNPTSIKPLVKVGTFQDDVYRRDYTINTLYYNLNPDQFMEILDLTGRGLEDLKLKILDTPTEPRQTFLDDPSRMLRGVRFAATRGFGIAGRVHGEIYRMRKEILRVPFEVIHTELMKGAVSPMYFRILDAVGLTDVLFPEVVMNRGVFQHPEYHTEDVYEHILRVTEAIETDNPLLRIASYFHDVGKVLVSDGSGHAYNHIGKGLPIMKEILRKYKFSNHEVQYIYKVIQYHHIYHNLTNMYITKETGKTRSLRKIVTKHSKEFLQDIFLHTRADIISDNPQRKRFLGVVDEIMDDMRNIELTVVIENSKNKLTVTGHDIMELGYQGIEIGRIKQELQNLVDDGTMPNTRATLMAKLKEYAR